MRLSRQFQACLFFLTKIFRAHKNMSHLEVYAGVQNCCLCCLVLAYLCFVSWFLLMMCFCAREMFSSKKKLKKKDNNKKNKQTWNSLDNLILLYYCSQAKTSTTILPSHKVFRIRVAVFLFFCGLSQFLNLFSSAVDFHRRMNNW